MTISRKELLEAAECETPILNHLDELTEDAMKAIFFERIPTCEGSNSTKPLISPSKERVLTEKMGRNEYVIYKGVCCRCGETVEFKLRKTDIVTHTFPFFQSIIESKEKYGKVDLSCHESSKLADCITHGPYSSHELLIKKEGVKIWCETCHSKLIEEVEEATRAFLSGDVIEWANNCNKGLVPQEDLWKKELFTVWKIHKEKHMVVELRIDDRYYWLDDEFIKEVNETYGSTLTKERQYWKKEDILERNGNNDLEFLIHGQNKPCKAEFDAFTIDSSVAAHAGLEMGLYDFCGPDDAMGQMLIEPTAQTREYIEKVCLPCEPSQLVYSNDMMKYIMKAEGVDDGAVMRHNKFLLYSDYQRTPYWYHVSQRVKWVAGNRCSKCGRRDELQTHHLTYDHRGLEAKYPEDLICLCKRCHMKEHE